MKAFIVTVCVLIVAALAIVFFLLHRSGQTGSSEVEQWIGSQLQEIANSYLNPRLSFEKLDYQYPGTVTLQNLKLEAEDPNAHNAVTILGASRATITLAGIPKMGQPIVIERIKLESPEFRAVSLQPMSGKFVGFSQLMRSEESVAPASAPVTVPSPAPSPAPLPRRRLSDYFHMRLIELVDGKMIYDPRIPNTEPMELDHIHTRLDLEPGDGSAYRIKCGVERDPIFTMLIGGSVDINTFRAMDMEMSLKADLSSEKHSYLPPQLEKLLKQYDARGVLALDVNGDAPLLDPLKGNVNAKLLITQANVTFTNYRIPVESLMLEASLRDSKATVHTLKIQALEGEANVSGDVMMNAAKDATLRVDASRMKIQNLMSAKPEGAETQLAGEVDGHIEASAPAAVVAAKWLTPSGKAYKDLATQPLPKDWGKASLRVKDGHLVLLPVVKQLNASLRKVTSLMSGSAAPKDKLQIDTAFVEDRIEIRDLQFASDAVVARGRGTVRLDHSIDLTLNGGPLEKVQSKLGEFGKIIGAVTDSIACYRVTGTLENAGVSVEVGEKAVRTVEDIGSKVGEGVNKGLGTIGRGIEKIFGR
jgi:hypothetical protein